MTPQLIAGWALIIGGSVGVAVGLLCLVGEGVRWWRRVRPVRLERPRPRVARRW